MHLTAPLPSHMFSWSQFNLDHVKSVLPFLSPFIYQIEQGKTKEDKGYEEGRLYGLYNLCP
jgi:hypothetical protein